VKRPTKQYRSGGENSSFMLDRRINGVGRIHRASGITNERQFDLLNDEIPALATTEKGRALLAGLRDGTITGLQLLVAIKANDLDSLVTGDTAAPLVTALEGWITATERTVAKATTRVRRELVTHVRSVAKPDAKIADLPSVMRRLKLTMPSSRSFNLDLQYASAFLRDTIGRRNETYLALRDIDVRKTSALTDRNPLMPSELVTLAAAVARVWKGDGGSDGREVFGMALTGMGPTEYWGSWQSKFDRVHVNGPKREARDRDVPNLFPCAIYEGAEVPRPRVSAASFARALNIARVATGIECSPYDLRRTFGNWMEAAGVLRSRRKQYLGHEIGDVTERYERHEVTAHLLKDAEKVRQWIASNRHTEADPNLAEVPK
jgi:hypothetical protein